VLIYRENPWRTTADLRRGTVLRRDLFRRRAYGSCQKLPRRPTVEMNPAGQRTRVTASMLTLSVPCSSLAGTSRRQVPLHEQLAARWDRAERAPAHP
jgi:hypothetical protein